jgi:adenosyl cobinamide kinase/adenosyl cobinamide phosphate guanylyltransferase
LTRPVVTLVLGGARSGKSVYAELLMDGRSMPVTYVATLRVGDDPDLSARVERHRQRRPATWRTVEAGLDLIELLPTIPGAILLDSLGGWVAAHGEVDTVDAVGLCRALAERTADTVVVSEEVGMGVHPSSASGRHFRDALGTVNQAVAALADHVFLVVAGRALRLHEAP